MKIKETPRWWRLMVFIVVAGALLMYVLRPGAARDGAPPSPEADAAVPGGVLPAAIFVDEPPATRVDGLMDARLARDRSHAQELEGLAALASNRELAEETRQSAGAGLVSLTRRQARELEAEGLLRARGYPDAVVFLQESAGEVVLRSAIELTPAQAFAAAEVVARTANLPVEGITVLPRP